MAWLHRPVKLSVAANRPARAAEWRQKLAEFEKVNSGEGRPGAEMSPR